MLKRLTVAVAALFVLATTAFAAGTVPGFSLAQQQDSNGTPLIGCRLYVIQAGTTATPQNAYQDSGLTIALPNPVICDAYGRLPQLFLADGTIKLRLTKSNGTQVFAADGILVVGASSGGGGGSPVDPTTVIATGDLKVRYGTGVLSGFVRANGRTIGSATSGATERANSDTQVLFQYLWDTDVNLAVSGGRGASSAADWSANKTIATPDWRGRVLAGLDDMGSAAAGRLTAAYFGAVTGSVGTTLGAAGGNESHMLLTTQMPSHNHTLTDPGHQHGLQGIKVTPPSIAGGGSLPVYAPAPGGSSPPSGSLLADSNQTGISIAAAGGGLPHPIMSPAMLATIYIKL